MIQKKGFSPTVKKLKDVYTVDKNLVSFSGKFNEIKDRVDLDNSKVDISQEQSEQSEQTEQAENQKSSYLGMTRNQFISLGLLGELIIKSNSRGENRVSSISSLKNINENHSS